MYPINARPVPIGVYEDPSVESDGLGWGYWFSKFMHPEYQRLYVKGYKRDRLITVLSALVRPELGGSLTARVTWENANKVIGRF